MPTIPVKKPRKLAKYPPEQQYPPAPAYPQRDVPLWTKPDTHTPPPKLGTESPPQKRGWFGWVSKTKGRPRLIQQLPAKRESQLHHDNEPRRDYQPLDSFSYAARGAPKLSEGALQGEAGHTGQIKREKGRRKSIVSFNGEGDYHSRQSPIVTHKHGNYPKVDAIVQNDRQQVTPLQPRSFSRDVLSYSEPVSVEIRTDDVPHNITEPEKDHDAHTRMVSRYEVTANDTTRQSPLRHQSKADVRRQYEEHQVSSNKEKDSALFQTPLPQHGPQNKEKSPRVHRTRDNENTQRPVRQYAYANQKRKDSELKREATSPKDRVPAQTQNEARHIPQKEGPSDARESECRACGKPDGCVRPLESVKTTVPMLQRRAYEPKELERTEGYTIRPPTKDRSFGRRQSTSRLGERASSTQPATTDHTLARQPSMPTTHRPSRTATVPSSAQKPSRKSQTAATAATAAQAPGPGPDLRFGFKNQATTPLRPSPPTPANAVSPSFPQRTLSTSLEPPLSRQSRSRSTSITTMYESSSGELNARPVPRRPRSAVTQPALDSKEVAKKKGMGRNDSMKGAQKGPVQSVTGFFKRISSAVRSG